MIKHHHLINICNISGRLGFINSLQQFVDKESGFNYRHPLLPLGRPTPSPQISSLIVPQEPGNEDTDSK